MYKIMGKYGEETEEIDTAKNKKEAEYLLCEYKLAFGRGWTIWIKERKAVKCVTE
jgi:hypothetical protein